MTDEEIISSLRRMVDRLAELLERPMIEGTLPTLQITLQPKDGSERLRLTVGAQFVEDEDF